jgi:hypothetical protein
MSSAATSTTTAEPAAHTRRNSGDAATDPNSPAVGRHHRLAPVVDRGQTAIEHQVIESIAALITREERGVGGAARRVLGMAVTGEDAEQAPRVGATVADDVVSLWILLSRPTRTGARTDRLGSPAIDGPDREAHKYR